MNRKRIGTKEEALTTDRMKLIGQIREWLEEDANLPTKASYSTEVGI
jgi:hypothetical protein